MWCNVVQRNLLRSVGMPLKSIGKTTDLKEINGISADPEPQDLSLKLTDVAIPLIYIVQLTLSAQVLECIAGKTSVESVDMFCHPIVHMSRSTLLAPHSKDAFSSLSPTSTSQEMVGLNRRPSVPAWTALVLSSRITVVSSPFGIQFFFRATRHAGQAGRITSTGRVTSGWPQEKGRWELQNGARHKRMRIGDRVNVEPAVPMISQPPLTLSQ
ncbi:hypothetical protein BC835DRAFT_1531311 [Cytidiella melzeri]|nr:hypothetical protein BC835DRAFT_1531311 [Cytidiella melzeri]